MTVTQSSPPASEEQVSANPAPALSPVQSRLRWMEIATRLLLLASVALVVWAALSVFIRPVARKFITEPRYSRGPVDTDGKNPVDFYRPEDDEEEEIAPPPRIREPSRRPGVTVQDDNDDSDDNGKVKLVAGTALKDAKLYGQPSDKSAEIGDVQAGESIFVMKEATGWVLVLRGQGAMMGWMRRDNLRRDPLEPR